ncbi:FixH family protein [Candidatus Chloroploca sp. M-50]|uniref:FixH family protein n=1 Tax=Candidatus Chloroploca mongolica TaxID=2528176 RepID=A0ABS4D7S6_9CHLR|nr:FixH family protein [Candidatus Chloroploca mongolica]MBP1465492.1 FixH family protein [Candidatus Chloroploca mongolica]
MGRNIFLLCACFFFFTACGTPPPAPEEELTQQQQTIGDLTIAFEGVAVPRINTSQQFVITLTDETGQPRDGADVYIDMTMPAMPMGINRPIAEPEGEGRYVAYSAYTMEGDWEMIVVVRLGDDEYRAVFPVVAVE